MSQYTFRIWFTGLVHFVENKDPFAKCQLCVVLPCAQDSNRRHTGAIYEVSREPYCGKLRLRPGDPIGPEFLDRHRIAFKITRTDDIPPEPAISPSFPYGFLHLQDIAGIFADENDQIVSDYPPDPVLAQILVEGGYWLGYDEEISVLRWWDIPQTLTGFSSLSLPLADPVFVETPNVEKVEIFFYKIGKDDTVVYRRVLRPGSNGFIEILATNSCHYGPGNHCLLDCEDLDFQWLENGQHLQIRQIDRDFEYHFRLLHPSTIEAIKKVLPKKLSDEPRFPVPESPLIDVIVAPHICLEKFFRPRPRPEPPPPERHFREERIEERAKQIVSHWFPDAGELCLKFLIDLLIIILGTGTGSGNDCLGTKARARFVDLDYFIPAPQPSVSLSVLHRRAALDRQLSFPFPGDPRYPFSKSPQEQSVEESVEKASPETEKK